MKWRFAKPFCDRKKMRNGKKCIIGVKNMIKVEMGE
jgi:hypothetical protein